METIPFFLCFFSRSPKCIIQPPRSATRQTDMLVNSFGIVLTQPNFSWIQLCQEDWGNRRHGASLKIWAYILPHSLSKQFSPRTATAWPTPFSIPVSPLLPTFRLLASSFGSPTFALPRPLPIKQAKSDHRSLGWAKSPVLHNIKEAELIRKLTWDGKQNKINDVSSEEPAFPLGGFCHWFRGITLQVIDYCPVRIN